MKINLDRVPPEVRVEIINSMVNSMVNSKLLKEEHVNSIRRIAKKFKSEFCMTHKETCREIKKFLRLAEKHTHATTMMIR